KFLGAILVAEDCSVSHFVDRCPVTGLSDEDDGSYDGCFCGGEIPRCDGDRVGLPSSIGYPSASALLRYGGGLVLVYVDDITVIGANASVLPFVNAFISVGERFGFEFPEEKAQ
ncbi:hypothetical protein FOZ63_011336, partial [Perkinsus olseni]